MTDLTPEMLQWVCILLLQVNVWMNSRDLGKLEDKTS